MTNSLITRPVRLVTSVGALAVEFHRSQVHTSACTVREAKCSSTRHLSRKTFSGLGLSCRVLLLKTSLESCDNTSWRPERVTRFLLPSSVGCPGDLHCLRSCTKTICSLARQLHSAFLGPAASAGRGGNELPDHGQLESLARSLLVCFERGERPGLLKPQGSCHPNSKEEPREFTSGADCSGGVPTRACEPHGDTAPEVPSQPCTPSRIQWV